MSPYEDIGFWRGWLAGAAVALAVFVVLFVLASCHLGEVAMAPGVSVGYDPATGNEYLSVGATFAPPLRHDRVQWEQAFGRRTGDIETIARLRSEAATATKAKSDAEAAERAVRASLEAVTTRADRAEELAKAEWWERILDRIFTTDINANQLGALALLAVVAVVVRRRRKGAPAGPAS